MVTKTQGFAELDANLKSLGDRGAIRRTAERALKRAAEPIQAAWEHLVPIDKGDLRASIKIGRAVKSEQKRGNAGSLVTTFVGIDESINRRLHIYAEVQEFGTSRVPAHPAGRPAWEANKGKAIELIGQTLTEEIVKTAGRQARKAAKAGL